jgi:hypothetical protein
MSLIQRKYTDLGYAQPDITGSILIHSVADSTITQQSYLRTLKNDPDGFKMYRSMEFEFQVPLSPRFSLSGNYTWARTIGNNLWNDDNGSSSNQGYTNAGDFRESYRAMGYTDSQCLTPRSTRGDCNSLTPSPRANGPPALPSREPMLPAFMRA